MISSIYISRAPEDVPGLLSFCEDRKIVLTAISLIRFEALPFIIKHSFDVVFFSSPRSVDYFLDHHVLLSETQIACVGKGTAESIKARGLNPDFIGPFPGEPTKNALSLAHWLGNRRILFPVSEISMGSMVEFIPEQQIEVLTVYRTIPIPASIPDHDVYVFSSPSNVESYLMTNNSPKGKVFAWGRSTQKALKKHSIDVVHTLETSDETELITILVSLQ